PAGPVDGLNLFCMVRNNPISRKDLLGLGPFDWIRSRQQNSYQHLASTAPSAATSIRGVASGIGSTIYRGMKAFGSAILKVGQAIWSWLRNLFSRTRSATPNRNNPQQSQDILCEGTATPSRFFSIPFTQELESNSKGLQFRHDLLKGYYNINGERTYPSLVSNYMLDYSSYYPRDFGAASRVSMQRGEVLNMDDAEIWSNTMKGLMPNKMSRTFVKSLAHQGMNEFALETFNQATQGAFNLNNRKGESTFIVNTVENFASITYQYYVPYSGNSDTEIGNSGYLTLQYSVESNFNDMKHPIIHGSSDAHPYGMMQVFTSPNGRA
ncbi:hypothetical protein, partial [Shewanella sp. S23-S33]|uniref:hypothetical protein n=1 Tax=Shewanella sp. S23-S33 TaxID=3342769 RepID=UPI00372D2D91